MDTSLDNKILKTPHDLLLLLSYLYNGIEPDIVTLKKYRSDIFSECCSGSFKVKFLRYVNEVLFEIVITALKDTYFGVKNPTVLKNEVST